MIFEILVICLLILDVLVIFYDRHWRKEQLKVNLIHKKAIHQCVDEINKIIKVIK